MSTSVAFDIVITAAAVALAWFLVRLGRVLWRVDTAAGPLVRVFGAYSPVLTWLKFRRLPAVHWLGLATPQVRVLLPWQAMAELGAISLWAGWVGREFLDFDPTRWVAGGDWALNLVAYFPWTWLSRCGACVLWNGAVNGGAPAFVELVGAVTHPLWVLAILLFGVVVASKVMIVAALALAGWAQWWLAKVLRLGALARWWTAAAAVAGGHLAGRLASGLVEEVFSVAACSLALAAAVDLALTGRRRAVVALGLTLGLAALAGQGYMQIGLVACVFPGLIFFMLTGRLQRRPVIRSFLVAGALAILVAGILWVPWLHFAPNFVKPTTIPEYSSIQSLEQLLGNLLIGDPAYYAGLERGGLPWTPAWHVNYLGWVPVLLALVGVRLETARHRRVLAFALSGLLLIYLVGSATLLKWLVPFIPQAVLSLRTPSVITSLAVPLILLLAALGLQALWRARWPDLILRLPNQVVVNASVRWLLLVPLLWSLRALHASGQQWMAVQDDPRPFYDVIGGTDLAGRQWVGTPYGESSLVVVALQSGLKVTDVVRPWIWREKSNPPMHYSFTRNEVDENDPAYLGMELGMSQVVYPDVQYAAVMLGSEVVPCQASAIGGNIDVICDLPGEGQLIVAENAWPGWSVRRDGQPADLLAGRWLGTVAPAGLHRFEFRYRPWDVALGAGLSLAGLGWALYLWVRRAKRKRPLAPVGRDVPAKPSAATPE